MIDQRDPVEVLLDKLGEVKQVGEKQWKACCPAHDDSRASLAISRGEDQRALVHCYAGCDPSAVVAAIGLEMRDLMVPRESAASFSGKAVASDNGKKRGDFDVAYDYRSADGLLLYQAVRYRDPKGFSQRVPKPGGGWEYKLNGVPRVLYRLAELREADPTATVYVAEGEKDVDRLRSLGLVATTNVAGAGKWRDEYSEELCDRSVVILPDNDEPGRNHAQKVAASLSGKAASIKVIEPPGLRDKGDISDWLNAGETVKELQRLVDAAPEWTPPKSKPSTRKSSAKITAAADDFHLTDLGNARRFIKRHGKDVRYSFPLKTWFCYDGRRWERDDSGQIERLGKETVAELLPEVAKIDDSRDQEAMGRFALASQQAPAIAHMLQLARSDCPVLPGDFDVDALLLNCPNGTLDLRSGQLREHRREDLLSRLCPTPFNPNAECPEFLKFLDKVFGGRSGLITFAITFFGYCLTGNVREQLTAIFWGEGSNGKSTLLGVIQHVLGSDYMIQAVSDFLVAKRGNRHSTEQFDLMGKRLAVCTETDEGTGLNEALLKQLTGGENIRARPVFKDNIEFAPTHKIVLCTNHKPEIKNTDHGIWRRLALVPFAVRFWDPDKGETGDDHLKVDKRMMEKLLAEREGILALLVGGCLDWQRHGLRLPKEVLEATAKYRREEDQVQHFLDDCCLRGPNYQQRAASVYAAYREWIDQQGEPPMTQTKFGRVISQKGIGTKKSGCNWYVGVALRSENEQ